ncbi:hypothetical protein BJF78_02225 [Pseudonocardia sp. CNS-139]|nr:hypothetical protein BJF78_02225 [Pseudonocardia sp. CNS-139]
MGGLVARGRVLAAGVAAAAALALTACGGGGAAETTPEGLTRVQVAFNPASQFAPMFAGMEQGIFARHGLELEIVPQTDVAAIVSGLASGQYDFGFATAVHLVTPAPTTSRWSPSPPRTASRPPRRRRRWGTRWSRARTRASPAPPTWAGARSP